MLQKDGFFRKSRDERRDEKSDDNFFRPNPPVTTTVAPVATTGTS